MASQPSSDTSLLPPIQRNEDGPANDVFTCPLCCEIPLEPVVTPCHHIFCRPCIVQALQAKHECPNDRLPLEIRELQVINGALRRVWEHIPVRCPKDQCTWTGTMGNYECHVRRCMRFSFENAQEYERHLLQLEKKYEDQILELTQKLATVEERFDRDLQQTVSRLRSMAEHDKKEAIAALRQKFERAWEGNVEAQGESHKFAPHCPLDSNYRYDRCRVVELTQLICRNLENKPSDVDNNRIFNCIKNCYHDFEKGWTDNPDNYLLDLRMLLNVCRASTWFSEKQHANIKKWCTNQKLQGD